VVEDCIEVTDPPIENNNDATAKAGQSESTVTTEDSGSCGINGNSESKDSESDDSDDESDDAEEMSDDSDEDEE
jgi:hypothetical protein